ncbi:MAG TPA: 1,4-alpha-glucan branching protein, partial [Candidatus Binatia bacterium]|nr:1,4-alpha-glucan branching protein [Candidatus Binatia bacterium]
MLGARLENNGAHFRVWAPNADQAFVAYDNHWDRLTGFELTRNGEYFNGFIPGAAVGTRYKFIFVENGHEVWRIDPAARDTTHSGLGDPANGGVVVNRAFNWPPFRTPRFEDLIIYQLHVGTFAGMNDHFAAIVQNGTAKIDFIESKLDYIKDLGFNAVQLLPIQEF